jgi:hypothetical protein
MSCTVSDDWTQDEAYLRCVEHGNPMDHVGLDGDTPVCKKYADENGCNCCPENYNKRAPVVLKLGDKVEVHGMVFTLTSISYDNPSKLMFEEKK